MSPPPAEAALERRRGNRPGKRLSGATLAPNLSIHPRLSCQTCEQVALCILDAPAMRLWQTWWWAKASLIQPISPASRSWPGPRARRVTRRAAPRPGLFSQDLVLRGYFFPVLLGHRDGGLTLRLVGVVRGLYIIWRSATLQVGQVMPALPVPGGTSHRGPPGRGWHLRRRGTTGGRVYSARREQTSLASQLVCWAAQTSASCLFLNIRVLHELVSRRQVNVRVMSVMVRH